MLRKPAVVTTQDVQLLFDVLFDIKRLLAKLVEDEGDDVEDDA